MKPRLLGFALLCGAAVGARADAEHDRIASERSAANARLTAQVRECESRFIVAPCLDAARSENRAALAQLRQQELQLDEGRRRAAAEARRKAIADKVGAQRGRASDAAAEAPHVHVRREPQVAPAPARRASEAGAPPMPALGPSGPDRAAIEQRNQRSFAARASEAQAHRDAVARRNADRAAQGKVAAPLPAPGASALR